MTIPRTYLFPWIVLYSLLFFSFSDSGSGILPVSYVYLMFVIAALIVAPFFLKSIVPRTPFYGQDS